MADELMAGPTEVLGERFAPPAPRLRGVNRWGDTAAQIRERQQELLDADAYYRRVIAPRDKHPEVPDAE